MQTNISRKELIGKFRALGYSGPFSGGKHQFMIKGKKNPHSQSSWKWKHAYKLI